DCTPAAAVTNGRPLTGGFAPVHDQAFAFSTNPATPWYAYVSNGSSVRRLDVRTMTEAPGDGWPVANEPEAVWLQQSERDGLFVWMRGRAAPRSSATSRPRGRPRRTAIRASTSRRSHGPA